MTGHSPETDIHKALERTALKQGYEIKWQQYYNCESMLIIIGKVVSYASLKTLDTVMGNISNCFYGYIHCALFISVRKVMVNATIGCWK